MFNRTIRTPGAVRTGGDAGTTGTTGIARAASSDTTVGGESGPESLAEAPRPGASPLRGAQFAVRAVVVHAPRQWSGGTVCRNDAAPHPCRLHQWGRQVLVSHGLGSAEIDALIERGDPGVGSNLPGRSGA